MASADEAPVQQQFRKRNQWDASWEKVQNGDPLWKSVEFGVYPSCSHQMLVRHGALADHNTASPDTLAKQRVYVPLGGDCKMITYLHELGYSVVVNEWCDPPIANLKKAIPGEWQVESLERTHPGVSGGAGATESPAVLVHISPDKRLIVWQCSYLVALEDDDRFDVVYDKDAFGAISPSERSAYAQKSLQHLKSGGMILLEAKDKTIFWQQSIGDADPEDPVQVKALFESGPPYHITIDIVFANYNGCQQLAYDPECYPMPGDRPWKQQSILLKK